MDITETKIITRAHLLKYFDLLDVEEQINIAGYVEHRYKQQEEKRRAERNRATSGDTPRIVPIDTHRGNGKGEK